MLRLSKIAEARNPFICKHSLESEKWRRGWDSNPRNPCGDCFPLFYGGLGGQVTTRSQRRSGDLGTIAVSSGWFHDLFFDYFPWRIMCSIASKVLATLASLLLIDITTSGMMIVAINRITRSNTPMLLSVSIILFGWS